MKKDKQITKYINEGYGKESKAYNAEERGEYSLSRCIEIITKEYGFKLSPQAIQKHVHHSACYKTGLYGRKTEYYRVKDILNKLWEICFTEKALRSIKRDNMKLQNQRVKDD